MQRAMIIRQATRRVRVLLDAVRARLDQERLRHLARWGAWSVRVLVWRQRARQAVTAMRTFSDRLNASTKLAYYVLPPALLRPRRRAEPRRVPPEMATVRIIVNPASGSIRSEGDIEALRATAAWLTERGMPAEVCLTHAPGDAARLASEAVRRNMDVVVAAGGDGTVNGVIQALAGHETALGVLPMGTVNVWAREMGISMNLAEAREVLLSGVRRRVDLGRAGSRYFLLMAGVGFDAEVARRVDRRRGPLKRLGLKLLDYIATAGVLSVTQAPARVWMRYDGKRRSVNALMIIIGNTRLYGGALSFAKQAVADDGVLDLVILENGGLVHRLGVLGRALVRRASFGPRVSYRKARLIRMESNERLPVQVDGEVIGTLPMTFSAAPSALTVIVPPDALPALFSRPPLPAPGSPTHNTTTRTGESMRRV
ncbi:MAG: diacylglycerol/lipid kinase family protein [Ktedonobacterales bacterium]